MEYRANERRILWAGHRLSGQHGTGGYLTPGSMMKITGDMRGAEIVCRTGIVWVTQEGDQQDYLLTCGDRFFVSRSGLVLIQSLGDGQAQVVARRGLNGNLQAKEA